MSDDLEPVAVSLHGGQRLDNGHRLVGMCWADSDTLTLFGVQKPPEYRPEAVPIGDGGGAAKRQSQDRQARASGRIAAQGTQKTHTMVDVDATNSSWEGARDDLRILHAKGCAIFTSLERGEVARHRAAARGAGTDGALPGSAARGQPTAATDLVKASKAYRRALKQAVKSLCEAGVGTCAHLFLAERIWALVETCMVRPEGVVATRATRQSGGAFGVLVARWLHDTFADKLGYLSTWDELVSIKLFGTLLEKNDVDGSFMQLSELAKLSREHVRQWQRGSEVRSEANSAARELFVSNGQQGHHTEDDASDVLFRLFWPLVVIFVRRGELTAAFEMLSEAVPDGQWQDNWRFVQNIGQLLGTYIDFAPEDAVADDFSERYEEWLAEVDCELQNVRSTLPPHDPNDFDGMSMQEGGQAAHPVLDPVALRRGAEALLRLLRGEHGEAGIVGFELDEFAFKAAEVWVRRGEDGDIGTLPSPNWAEALCARLLFGKPNVSPLELGEEANKIVQRLADGDSQASDFKEVMCGDANVILHKVRSMPLWVEVHLADLIWRADTHWQRVHAAQGTGGLWQPLTEPPTAHARAAILDGATLRDNLLLRFASSGAINAPDGWEQGAVYVRAVARAALCDEGVIGQGNDAHVEAAKRAAVWQSAAALEAIVGAEVPSTDAKTEKMLAALGVSASSGLGGAASKPGQPADLRPMDDVTAAKDEIAASTIAVLAAAGSGAAGSAGVPPGFTDAHALARSICVARARLLLGGRGVGSLGFVQTGGKPGSGAVHELAHAAAWIVRAVQLPMAAAPGGAGAGAVPTAVLPPPPPPSLASVLLAELVGGVLRAALLGGRLFAAHGDNAGALRMAAEAVRPVARALWPLRRGDDAVVTGDATACGEAVLRLTADLLEVRGKRQVSSPLPCELFF
jgi:hypothetical protein